MASKNSSKPVRVNAGAIEKFLIRSAAPTIATSHAHPQYQTQEYADMHKAVAKTMKKTMAAAPSSNNRYNNNSNHQLTFNDIEHIPIPSVPGDRADLPAFTISDKSALQHPDILTWQSKNIVHKPLDALWKERIEPPVLQTIETVIENGGAKHLTNSNIRYTFEAAHFKNYHVHPPHITQVELPEEKVLQRPSEKRKINEVTESANLLHKELKEAVRERRRLMKLAGNAHKRGVLGSEDVHLDSSEVYGAKAQLCKSIREEKLASWQVRRERIGAKEESQESKETWKPNVPIAPAASSVPSSQEVTPYVNTNTAAERRLRAQQMRASNIFGK